MPRKNKPGQGRKVERWTPERVKMLRHLYPRYNNEFVAGEMLETVSAIRNAAVRFKVKKSQRYWDKPWEDYLLKNWPGMTAEEIAEGLKKKFKVQKTRWAIINKHRALTDKRQPVA